MAGGNRIKYVPFLIVLGIVAALPHFLDIYWTHVAIYTLWWIYLCVAWDISAQTRMYSIGHTLFLGAGGYVAVLLFLNLHISPWLGMWAGVLIALLLALLMGYLGFRFGLSPLSFVIMTLAFAFIADQVVTATPALGQERGFRLYFTSDDPANFLWLSKVPYYYIILAMTLGAIAVNYFILRSKLGLYFKAIHDNERAAAAAGVDILKYKLYAFLISAALTSLAGTFWGQYAGLINPENHLAIIIGVLMILYTAIGGVGTLWGSIAVPAFFVPLGEFLRSELGARYAGANLVLIGILVVIVLVLIPQGIFRWWREWRLQRQEARLLKTGSRSAE